MEDCILELLANTLEFIPSCSAWQQLEPAWGVCVCVCMYVHVCVCERERSSKREIEQESNLEEDKSKLE